MPIDFYTLSWIDHFSCLLNQCVGVSAFSTFCPFARPKGQKWQKSHDIFLMLVFGKTYLRLALELERLS